MPGKVNKKECEESPLQPERMSMPITCSMHDIIFHVIFGHDYNTILEFVNSSAARLNSICQCKYLQATMQAIQQQNEKGQHVPIDVLKAMFFLFLNVDMILKDYICNPGSRDAFAAAMNAKRNSPSLDKMHAWSMVGTRCISAEKAINFFTALNKRVVKQWLQDERKGPMELLNAVKDEYLVS